MATETEVKKEKVGIEGTLKFLDGIDVIVPAGVEIAADKKLSAKDIKPVVEVIKKYEVLVEAFESKDIIIPEIKDLDTVELAQIGAKVIEIFKKSKAAYEAGK